MARGKYGAAAAKRRALSAEEQLDRLLPKLIDAERTAKRYASEAAAAPILRAELAKLRDVIGVPVADHETSLNEQRHRQDTQRAAEQAAWMTIIDDVANYLDNGKLHGDTMPLSSSKSLTALRTVPRPIADHLLRRLGMEREIRRFLLEDTTANRAKQDGTREAIKLAVVARATGIKGGIPANWVSKPLRDPDTNEMKWDHLDTVADES